MTSSAADATARLTVLAASQPDALAVKDVRRELTYAELLSAALQTAHRLQSHGVTPGARVGLISENSADYVVATFGTWMAGATLAPIHPAFGSAELDYIIGNAKPDLVLLEEGAGLALRGRNVRSAPLKSMTRLELGHDQRDAVAVDPSAAAIIYYTSGSTGRPKPVAHSHAGVIAGTSAFQQIWHLGPTDRTLVCLTMSWAFGLTTAAIAGLMAGGAVVVLPKYNPVRVTDAISREKITVFHGVTTMFVKLLEYLKAGAHELHTDHLRVCVSGGEPRNEPAFAEWRTLTGCEVLDNYSATECWPVVSSDSEAFAPPLGSAGKVVPGAALRVVNAGGVDVAPGTVGEALWRAPGMMLGYWNEPELTAEAMTDDGWYRTRDLVRVDEEGYVYVVGRVADTIIRGGSNISPAEVEAVLARHQAIRDVAIVGIPDPVYGQEVAAAVVLNAGASLDPSELADFCRSELAAFKIPTRFREVGELPRNANGKLARRDLAPLIGNDAAPVT